MNSQTLKGKWNQLKGNVQKQWGKITNDEVDQIKGDATRLRGIIQEKYGKTKEEAQEEISKWQEKQ